MHFYAMHDKPDMCLFIHLGLKHWMFTKKYSFRLVPNTTQHHQERKCMRERQTWFQGLGERLCFFSKAWRAWKPTCSWPGRSNLAKSVSRNSGSTIDDENAFCSRTGDVRNVTRDTLLTFTALVCLVVCKQESDLQKLLSWAS